MKKYLLLLALPILIISCNNNHTAILQHTCEKDSVRYSNLIMNLIMNNYKYLVPDYGYEGQLLYSDTTYYLYKGTKVLSKVIKKDTMNGFTGSREINDAELGLDIRIHRWTCGCEVSLPNTIIYISNRKDIDYAFIFHDESLIDTIPKGTLPNGPPTLEFQLNYLTNRLQINFVSDKKQVQHFLSLITDSLLCLKKVRIQDTIELRGAGNINQMIKDLQSGNADIAYYNSSTQYFKGFWRFEFVTYKGDRLYIKAEFNKCKTEAKKN